MAAPVQTTTIRTNTLKYMYLDMIREVLATGSPLRMRLEEKTTPTTTPDGKGWIMDVEYAPHGASGLARAEAAALPTAGSRSDIQSSWGMKSIYSVTDFTGQTISNLGSNKSSFDGSGTGRNLKTLVTDHKKKFNRMLFGTGFGYLGMVASASTATLTFHTASAASYILGFGGCFGTKFLHKGLHTDIVDFAAGTSMTLEGADEAGGILTAVTSTTAVQTTDPDFTEASGDFMVPYGALTASTATAPVPMEPFGLYALCSDVDADDCISLSGTSGVTTGTSVGGLAIGTYDWWKGNVVFNGTTAAKFAVPQELDLKSMDEAYYESPRRKNDPKLAPTAAYTTWKTWYKYADILRADRRYDGAVMTLDGGWKALNYNDIPIIPDDDAVEGMMFWVHEPSLILFQPEPIDFIDQGEGVLKWLSGYDGYIAVLRHYCQLATDDRSKHTILYNINEF